MARSRLSFAPFFQLNPRQQQATCVRPAASKPKQSKDFSREGLADRIIPIPLGSDEPGIFFFC
jgi:hypothetical protein